MESTFLAAFPRRRLLRSWAVPVLLSLAVHALLVLAMTTLPAADGTEDRPLMVDTCVIGDFGFTVGLDSPQTSRSDAEAPPLLSVSVGELPPSPPAAGVREPGAANRSGGPESIPGSPTADKWNGGEGHGPGAAWTGPAIFQVRGSGRSVVYVIDRSLSMGLNGALGAARSELLASLAQLPETARFQVILFNRQAEPLRLAGRTDLAPATSGNKERVTELLAALRAEGGTDHLAALRRALALQSEVVFFITDACELTPQQVRIIAQQNQGRTAIHAIELSQAAGGSGDDSPLSLLARSNRGMYRSVCLGNLALER